MRDADNAYKAALTAVLDQIEKIDNFVDRQKLVMAKYSQAYIRSVGDENLGFSQLQKISPETIQDTTNALAIAISLADVSACEILLEYYDKNSINSTDSFVWGYRELYTFLHLALDPLGHFTECRDHNFYDGLNPREKKELQNRLIAIIGLLVEKGANPDIMCKGIYSNPATAGGRGRGYGALPHEILTALRAELLLAGADLGVAGSYFKLPSEERERIMQYAKTRFEKANFSNQLSLYERTHPSMQEELKPIIQNSLESVTTRARELGLVIKLEIPSPSSNSSPQFFSGRLS